MRLYRLQFRALINVVIPMLNMKTRLQTSLQVCVNYNVRKVFLFVQEKLFLHFKTFDKVNLRLVMNVHRKFEAGFHVV